MEPTTCDTTSLSLSELSSLYVLDMLDAAEQAQYEAAFLDHPAQARTELAVAEAHLGYLAFAVPPCDPSPSLRSRLMDAVQAEGSQTSPLQKASVRPVPAPKPDFVSETIVVHSNELPWKPFLTPGSHAKHLYTDFHKREIVYLVRAEQGVSFPPHRHADCEEFFMLKGELEIDGVAYAAGDYVRAAGGSVHGPNHALSDCMFLLKVSIDNQILSQEEYQTLS